MIWLQLSANTGPEECCLGVVKALRRLEREAAATGVSISLLEEAAGPVAGTLRSVLLQLQGDGCDMLARRWCGSILWICESPYRRQHKRKNWFLQGVLIEAPAAPADGGGIRYEACRAAGPGGQHVNKTDSAIRATHVATGLAVKVQSRRSQHANKRLAGQLLLVKLAQRADADLERLKVQRHAQHRQAERGNAQRTFVGAGFVEQI